MMVGKVRSKTTFPIFFIVFVFFLISFLLLDSALSRLSLNQLVHDMKLFLCSPPKMDITARGLEAVEKATMFYRGSQ